jgi:hypothetical protein
VVRFPARRRNFSTVQNDETISDPRTASSLMVSGDFISGIGRPGSEFEGSLPPNSEVKNKWRYAFPPPIRFHAVDREYFNYYFTFPRYVRPNKLLNSVFFMQFI